MYFLGKHLSEIKEQDLLTLITNEEYEIKTLEYKLILPGGSDDEKKEFLADVSSFANSNGGFIVYGLEEKKGKAFALPGINEIDQNGVALRLEGIIRDGLQPRIFGVQIQPVLLSTGNIAIIIEIPKSFNSPHMVTFRNQSRFFARNSAGKFQLDINEIRQAFLFSDTLLQKIKNFYIERLVKIKARETPILLTEGASLVLHIVPVVSFQNPFTLSFGQKIYQYRSEIYSFIDDASNARRNFDGVVTYSDFGAGKTVSYTQVFRNGVIEAVDLHILAPQEGKKIIPAEYFEEVVINACRKCLGILNKNEIAPPYFIFLSMLNVKNFKMGVERGKYWSDLSEVNVGIDRNDLLMPELFLEIYKDGDLANLFKPIFDIIWNAVGWGQSPNYDENGKWKLTKK